MAAVAMTAPDPRAELVELIHDASFQSRNYSEDAADAILAAGWRPPAVPGQEWDIGDPEPDGVTAVVDDFADDNDDDNQRWGRCFDGDWKGYKNGGKVYLTWPELVRRWGPVRRA